MKFFKRKSIDDHKQESCVQDKTFLQRTFIARSIVLLRIGAIIGAGIFVIAEPRLAMFAGLGITISVVIAGLARLFIGLSYTILSAMIPIAERAYPSRHDTSEGIFSQIIRWTFIIKYFFVIPPKIILSRYSMRGHMCSQIL